MSSLESLGLSRCALEPEPLVALLQAAQLNKKLQALTLDASSNPIGMAGAHMLAAVLPQCTKVTGLFLDDVSSTVPYPFPLVGWPTQEGSMGMGGGGGSNGVDTSSGGGPESTCIGIQISEALLASCAPTLTSLGMSAQHSHPWRLASTCMEEMIMRTSAGSFSRSRNHAHCASPRIVCFSLSPVG